MLSEIQKWIESTYRLQARAPVSRYLINHSTLLSYLGEGHPLAHAEEALVVAGSNPDYELGLYLHLSLLQAAPGEDARRRSHRWLTVAEGVSHWLLMNDKLRKGQEVTQLEMELQGEIDKYFFATLGAPSLALIPGQHLDTPAELTSLTHGQKCTYETARRLASRYCRRMARTYLCGRSYDGLFEELRRFYRLSHWQKLRHIGSP